MTKQDTPNRPSHEAAPKQVGDNIELVEEQLKRVVGGIYCQNGKHIPDGKLTC
jgi:hypothetical protein